MHYKSTLSITGFALLLALTGCGKASDESQASQVQQEQAEPEEAADQESSEAPSEGEAALTDMIKIWGTVMSVDDSGITVDNQSGNSSDGEILLTVDPAQNTVIDAVTGLPVSLEEIEKQGFEAYLGPAMTMSLPPQTNPYLVVVNIPEDSRAPQYVIAAGALTGNEDSLTLEAQDGSLYQVPADVEILPFLTKNIVTADDIEEGTRCLIWADEENTAEKIVLFAD